MRTRLAASFVVLAGFPLAVPATHAAGRCHATLRISTPGFVTCRDKVYAAGYEGGADDMAELGDRFAELHAQHPRCHIALHVSKEVLFGNVGRVIFQLQQAGFDSRKPRDVTLSTLP